MDVIHDGRSAGARHRQPSAGGGRAPLFESGWATTSRPTARWQASSWLRPYLGWFPGIPAGGEPSCCVSVFQQVVRRVQRTLMVGGARRFAE